VTVGRQTARDKMAVSDVARDGVESVAPSGPGKESEVPRFRLVSPDGHDLGPFVSSVPNWTAGDEIPLGAGRRWRVVAVVWPSDDEPARLVVEFVGE
jgi:hypothetical protein